MEKIGRKSGYRLAKTLSKHKGVKSVRAPTSYKIAPPTDSNRWEGQCRKWMDWKTPTDALGDRRSRNKKLLIQLASPSISTVASGLRFLAETSLKATLDNSRTICFVPARKTGLDFRDCVTKCLLRPRCPILAATVHLLIKWLTLQRNVIRRLWNATSYIYLGWTLNSPIFRATE